MGRPIRPIPGAVLKLLVAIDELSIRKQPTTGFHVCVDQMDMVVTAREVTPRWKDIALERGDLECAEEFKGDGPTRYFRLLKHPDPRMSRPSLGSIYNSSFSIYGHNDVSSDRAERGRVSGHTGDSWRHKTRSDGRPMRRSLVVSILRDKGGGLDAVKMRKGSSGTTSCSGVVEFLRYLLPRGIVCRSKLEEA